MRAPFDSSGLSSRKMSAMTESASVRISRKGWGSSRSTHNRIWNLVLDGDVAGSIGNEQTIELPVEPGRHALGVTSMRYLVSPEESFEADEGQVVGFSCHPRSLTPLIFTRWMVWLLATLVKHDLWISLRPDDADRGGLPGREGAPT
jgi:hypothetical protein